MNNTESKRQPSIIERNIGELKILGDIAVTTFFLGIIINTIDYNDQNTNPGLVAIAPVSLLLAALFYGLAELGGHMIQTRAKKNNS